jgi:ParB-like chromosome segregation protein Spo0J
MIVIDTVEDYLAMRDQLQPAYIQSTACGPIRVPCVDTLLVRTEMLVANTWNPNHVPEGKMQLLETSIIDNGFCFPVVVIWDEDQDAFVVVDGFHRTLIARADWLGFDYVPVVVLDHDIAKRMIATKQFNAARGVHELDLDAELIRKLLEQGMDDKQIADKLGMDIEAVHRYKQVTGVAELFKNTPYSIAWEMADDGS